MTKDEAIKHLKVIKERIRGGDEAFDSQRKEAVDMAIEALEKYENLKKEHETLHNEHCQMCGAYKREYTGICDGCRWKR